MRLYHSYHLFVPQGRSKVANAIWNEHLQAVHASGLLAAIDHLRVCIVGEPIDVRLPSCAHSVVRVEDGHEAVTLGVLKRQADDLDPDDLLFYGHSKGVTYQPGTRRFGRAACWRRAMMAHTVRGWRDTVYPLVHGDVDVSGGFYLEPAFWAAREPRFGQVPYFAGNFWWATAAHIRRLPSIPTDVERHCAELWIGLAPHRAYSFTRNLWPNAVNCLRARVCHAWQRLRPSRRRLPRTIGNRSGGGEADCVG